MKYHNNKHSGFTIIEVSLVLAIAGLIIVMVFIALPALQRQARDAERKEDVLAFIEGIKKYQQNNHGTLPSLDDKSLGLGEVSWGNTASGDKEWIDFYNNYLGDNFTNPNGQKYSFYIEDCNVYSSASINQECTETPYFNHYDLYVVPASVCEDNKAVKSSNNRNLSIITPLETGGIYCANT